MTPPPLPPEYEPGPSYGKKIFLMGLICCVLMVAVLAVWSIVYSREDTNKAVTYEITSKWGESVVVRGPFAKADKDSVNNLTPRNFDCDIAVESVSLHRSIYEAEVFNSHVKMSGIFNRDSLALLGDTVVMVIDVDMRQVEKASQLNMGGKTFTWSRSSNYMYAKADISDMPSDIEFSTEFDVRGSSEISVCQIGENSVVTISGDAGNPSFFGDNLPNNRSVGGGKFYARWECALPAGSITTNTGRYIGTRFLVGVDRYQKVSRSMKYSFIIIVLTFASVLFVEIIKKHPIPLLNYFLIGVALIIFYSLLLSFSELISFGYAYLAAAAMTTSLITGYIWRMLDSRNLGLSIGTILAIMYLFCYIMLCLSTYALLFGSLLLFFALAAIMFGSLKINQA